MKEIIVLIALFLIAFLGSKIYYNVKCIKSLEDYNELLEDYNELLEEQIELIEQLNEFKLPKLNYQVIYLEKSETLVILDLEIVDGNVVEIRVILEITLEDYIENQ